MSRLALITCLIAAMALSACGRRGAPERPDPPPGVTMAPIDPVEPEDGTAPDRRFILDPLLQ